MYKLEFTLKQHTPLIHFQHDQAGATLRATEVKPKLDLFIMKNLLNDVSILEHEIRDRFKTMALEPQPDGSSHPWKHWLSGKGGNEHVALDYKLSFHCSENHSGEIQETKFINGQIERKRDGKIDVKSFPGFFANNGKENFDDLKWFSWSGRDIKARVITFDQTLKEAIEQSITAFFFHNNFGSRKTKGFGSFSVLNEDGKSKRPKDYSRYFFDIGFKTITNNEINSLILNYRIKGFGEITSYEAEFLLQNKYLFERIDLLYRALRSGINTPGRDGRTQFYIKSLLFYYFKVRFNKQWDKKSIKEYFYFSHPDLIRQKSIITDSGSPLNYAQPGSNSPNKLLIRDLLGLSTDQSWRSYGNDTISKISKETIDGEPKYARFASPIVFKPIRFLNKFRVYIEYADFPAELAGKTFNISSKNSRVRSLALDYPQTFSPADFLKFIFEDCDSSGSFVVDLENYVDSDFHEKNEFRNLFEIFDNIRENLDK